MVPAGQVTHLPFNKTTNGSRLSHLHRVTPRYAFKRIEQVMLCNDPAVLAQINSPVIDRAPV
jgi:hypothetical protein